MDSPSDFDVCDETLTLIKDNPWTSKVELGHLVGIHYETLVSSVNARPYQLLALVNQILDLFSAPSNEDIHDDKSEQGHGSKAADFFHTLLTRIMSTHFKPADADDVDKTYSRILSLHAAAPASIPISSKLIHKLLALQPQYLEQMFVRCFKNNTPLDLVLLCSADTRTFQIILDYLHQSYEMRPSSTLTLKFANKFMNLTKENSTGTSWIQLLPAPFHVLFYFIESAQNLDSSIMQDQILEYMESLYAENWEERSYITFVLLVNGEGSMKWALSSRKRGQYTHLSAVRGLE